MTLTVGEILCTAIEKVVFDQRAAAALPGEADRLGDERVFLVVSRTLDEQSDEIARTREARTDLIVTVGGGTLTDAGKIMLICLKYNIRAHDELEPYHVYVTGNGTVVKPELDPPDLRTIAIPTTLSGGEFNPLGGATDENRKIKQGFEQRLPAPVSLILDPALTVHTPEWLWSSTGARSPDHAMETLGSHLSNDYCSGLAESAIRLLVSGLAGVKADPSDLEARLKCEIGAWQSIVPLVSGVPMGASHAIGHVLGGTCEVPRGYTSRVMAPFVPDYNKPVNAARQTRTSNAFGAPDRPASELADEFISGLGMRRTLADVGVKEDKLAQIAEYTMEDFGARTNPRPIEKPSDVLEILQLAI